MNYLVSTSWSPNTSNMEYLMKKHTFRNLYFRPVLMKNNKVLEPCCNLDKIPSTCSSSIIDSNLWIRNSSRARGRCKNSVPIFKKMETHLHDKLTENYATYRKCLSREIKHRYMGPYKPFNEYVSLMYVWA